MIWVTVLIHGCCNEYIDDIITVGVEYGTSSQGHLQAAVHLTMYVIACKSEQLVAGTVRNTIGDVAQTFQSAL